MNRFLTKSGFGVRVPSGQYRGVYRDLSSARLVADLASLCELLIFEPPVITHERIWRWQRFGARVTPLS